MLVTPQYQTERVLEERATRAGADIRRGSEVTGLTQYPGAVEVKVRRDGHPDQVVRAGWVVGADGMGSLVRQALGLPFPGKPVVGSGMLADVRLAQPPPDVVTVNAPGDAFAFIAPFGDGWYRVIAWHRRNQPPEDTPVHLAEVAEVTRQVFGSDYGMHDPRWISRFHSDERQIPRYRETRALLAGLPAPIPSPPTVPVMKTIIQATSNPACKYPPTQLSRTPP